MVEKIYTLLISFLPLLTIIDTEAEMYNFYLLNTLIAVATIFATIISWHRNYYIIISYDNLLMLAFFAISLLSSIINNVPMYTYIYINISLVFIFIIISKKLIQKYIPLLSRVLCFCFFLLATISGLFFFFCDTENFDSFINNRMSNSGIFAIAISIEICIMSYMKSNSTSRMKKILFTLFMVFCVILILHTGCRTALIIIAAYYLFDFFKRNYHKNFFENINKQKIILSLIACIFIIGAIHNTLTDISKTNSLLGRVFIVNNCLNMIKEFPYIGHGGLGCFAVEYAHSQANWFSTHQMIDKKYILADNVIFASNEYLQIICESGLISMMILSLFTMNILHSLRKDRFILKCFALPLVFAANFYYIAHVSFFCSTLIIICIIASCRCKKGIIIKKGVKILFYLIFLYSSVLTYYNLQHYYTAKKIHKTMKYKSISYVQAVDLLNRFGENRKLIAMLPTAYIDSTNLIYQRAERYFLHSDMLWVEGRNLIQIGRDSLAEQKLILASKIVPNRFRYKYELLKLYKRQEDTLKCLNTANKIINMPIKIPSPTITAIKMEANEILEQYK